MIIQREAPWITHYNIRCSGQKLLFFLFGIFGSSVRHLSSKGDVSNPVLSPVARLTKGTKEYEKGHKPARAHVAILAHLYPAHGGLSVDVVGFVGNGVIFSSGLILCKVLAWGHCLGLFLEPSHFGCCCRAPIHTLPRNTGGILKPGMNVEQVF